jgi:hypothetical protein
MVLAYRSSPIAFANTAVQRLGVLDVGHLGPVCVLACTGRQRIGQGDASASGREQSADIGAVAISDFLVRTRLVQTYMCAGAA